MAESNLPAPVNGDVFGLGNLRAINRTETAETGCAGVVVTRDPMDVTYVPGEGDDGYISGLGGNGIDQQQIAFAAEVAQAYGFGYDETTKPAASVPVLYDGGDDFEEQESGHYSPIAGVDPGMIAVLADDVAAGGVHLNTTLPLPTRLVMAVAPTPPSVIAPDMGNWNRGQTGGALDVPGQAGAAALSPESAREEGTLRGRNDDIGSSLEATAKVPFWMRATREYRDAQAVAALAALQTEGIVREPEQLSSMLVQGVKEAVSGQLPTGSESTELAAILTQMAVGAGTRAYQYALEEAATRDYRSPRWGVRPTDAQRGLLALRDAHAAVMPAQKAGVEAVLTGTPREQAVSSAFGLLGVTVVRTEPVVGDNPHDDIYYALSDTIAAAAAAEATQCGAGEIDSTHSPILGAEYRIDAYARGANSASTIGAIPVAMWVLQDPHSQAAYIATVGTPAYAPTFGTEGGSLVPVDAVEIQPGVLPQALRAMKAATTFAVGDVEGHGMSLERQDTAKPNVRQLYDRFADPNVLGVPTGVWQVHTPPTDVTLEVAAYPGHALPATAPTSQPAPWGMPTAGTDVAGPGAPFRTPME